LPTLLSAWANGSIAGLRARGGFEVDFVWVNKQMKTLQIKSVGGTECKARCNGKTIGLILQKNAVKTFTERGFQLKSSTSNIEVNQFDPCIIRIYHPKNT